MKYYNLDLFKAQLRKLQLPVLDEYEYNDCYLFVLSAPCLTRYEILNLMGVHPFNILNMWYSGEKKLHLQLFPNI